MIFSRAWFGAALAGLVVLCVRPGPAGRLGRRLFILLGPASLLIGWVDNYMFETRRMVTVLAPLFVLSTTVLLFSLGNWLAGRISRLRPRRRKFSRMIGSGLPCLLAAALLAGAGRGRFQLYATWNNRSTYRFYRSLAGEVREAGDFLTAEYTQTAAPLERLARRPLLPIAWGYRSEDEYRQAERVLRRLVRNDPERRYLLISPFSGAAVALPAGPSARWLWLLAAPEREAAGGVRAAVREREGTGPGFDFPVEAGWNWHLVPLAPAGATRFAWYNLEVSPPWDPGLRNFPDDLGIRLHLLTVVAADQ